MMFKLFNKHKRSDWMEGLIAAEQYIESGYVRRDLAKTHIRLWNEEQNHGISWGIQHPQFFGIADYLDYYKNNLKIFQLGA